MDNSVRISAVVPVHGLENYLPTLKETLLNVARFPIDVVLIFDRISIGLTTEIRQFISENRMPRITIIEGHFGSAAAARNAGMAEVKTKWVAFWDADDSPDPLGYLTLVERAESESIEVGIGIITVENIGDPTRTKSHSIDEDSTILNQIAAFPGFTRMIFQTHFISGIQFQELFLVEDQCFLSDVFSRNPKIGYQPIALYTYFVGIPTQSIRSQRRYRDHALALQYIAHNLKSDSPVLTMNLIFVLKLGIVILLHVRDFSIKEIIRAVLNLSMVLRWPIKSLQAMVALKQFRSSLT